MQKVNRIRNVANAHYLLFNKTFSMSWTLKFVEKFQLDWNLYKGDMPTQTIKDKFNLWVLKIVLHWIKFETAPQCASIRFRFRRLNSKWQNFRALARTEVQNLYKQFNRTSVSQNFPLTFQFNRLLDESQKMLKANGYISRLFSPVKWLAKSKSEVLSRQLLGQEVSTTEIQYFARVYTAILDLAGPNFTWEFFPLFCYQVKPENQFQFPKKKKNRKLVDASHLNLAVFDFNPNDKMLVKIRASLEKQCEGCKMLETYVKFSFKFCLIKELKIETWKVEDETKWQGREKKSLNVAGTNSFWIFSC